jgi:hypothetical protein
VCVDCKEFIVIIEGRYFNGVNEKDEVRSGGKNRYFLWLRGKKER